MSFFISVLNDFQGISGASCSLRGNRKYFCASFHIDFVLLSHLSWEICILAPSVIGRSMRPVEKCGLFLSHDVVIKLNSLVTSNNTIQFLNLLQKLLFCIVFPDWSKG